MSYSRKQKEKTNLEPIKYLAFHVSTTMKEEAIKTRHKIKMLTLDVIWTIGGILSMIESLTYNSLYYIRPDVNYLLYSAAFGIVATGFFIAYIKSVFDEKRCEVCQER